jgi:ECF sigma factor
MGFSMASERADSDALLRRLHAGDAAAAGDLFQHYRDRLRRMVRLRLDRRLQGRVDPSDVLQDAYLDLARRVPEYVANPTIPFFLWLRLLTGQRLLMLHRQHLGTQMRDVGPAGARPGIAARAAGEPRPRPGAPRRDVRPGGGREVGGGKPAGPAGGRHRAGAARAGRRQDPSAAASAGRS